MKFQGTIKFQNLESRMVALAQRNIDTDQIIPARFLKTISKEGLGDNLFCDWRYDSAGKPRPDFILNQPQAKSAQVFLAGDNFGCGSSREHAPWALMQFGFRALISTSFADIFRANSLKNGLLPVVVPADVHAALFEAVAKNPDVKVRIDLPNQILTTPDGRNVGFPVDSFAKYCILEGVDEIGYTLQHTAEIAAFERGRGASIDTLV
jgi:3-isopropylmalate/(R)-2-methylmalate dehydratase small subunit